MLLLLAGRAAVALRRYAQSPRDDASFLADARRTARRQRSPTRTAIVEQLAQSGHPSVAAVLTALLEDRLYFRNDDQKVFIVKSARRETRPTLDLIDPLTLKDAGSAPRDDLTKIGTNNRLRRVLQTTVARFDLSSPDAVGPAGGRAARCCAILDDGNVAAAARARRRRNRRRASRRKSTTGLALAALDGSDRAGASRRDLDARATASARMCATGWRRLLEQISDGSFVESDAAGAAGRRGRGEVASTAGARSIPAIETLFFGLSLGSVLVLIAIGLAITFGVMGVINMAHGELMMLGAYTTYVVQLAMPNHIGDFDSRGDSRGVYRRRRSPAC